MGNLAFVMFVVFQEMAPDSLEYVLERAKLDSRIALVHVRGKESQQRPSTTGI